MKITRGDIITPANAITLAGLLLTIFGSMHLNTLTGLLFVVIGRGLDLVDGPVARMTHTSKFSAILDPVADKLALLSVLIGVVRFNLVPGYITIYVVLYNLLITYLSVKAFQQGTASHALIPGKINLFLQIISIFSFIDSQIFTTYTHVLTFMAYTTILVSLPFAVAAIKAYGSLSRPRVSATDSEI